MGEIVEEEEPLLSNPNNPYPKGGFRTLPFIVANQAFEKMASYGLMPNMILYLTRDFGMEAVEATNVLLLWSAATNFTPILGAFLADSYVGRYPIIAFGSVASLLGMLLFWLTTMIPELSPSCNQFSKSCSPPTTVQLTCLYSSLGLMSIGAGGVRASSLAFGIDQLGKKDRNAGIMESYFSWSYALAAAACLISMSFLVYIQENLGWKVGFGVPVVIMLISAVSFFLASPFYVKLEPKGNILTGFAQVVVASYKNRHLSIPQQISDGTCYCEKDSTLVMPSDKLRFLNKACLIRNPLQDLTHDGRATNSWCLCTVDQVEALKTLIKIVPIWISGMIMSVNMSQGSFQVLEAASLDRHITSHFEIPAASMGTILIISLILWIVIYDRIIIPSASKVQGRPFRLRVKQKMGLGILAVCISTASLGIVEGVRRKMAIEEGSSEHPKSIVNLSVWWLLPRQVLDGFAEAFNGIGQNEFFIYELPQSMSSIGSTLSGLGTSSANLLASLVLSIVDKVTKGEGKDSWVSSNINKGHYDYYYWLIFVLMVLNLMYFLYCSKAYGSCKGEEIEGQDEGGEYGRTVRDT